MAEITAVTQHASITGENIHVPYAGQFANEMARLSAQLDSSSEGKIYRQLDTNKLWMLVSASGPVWEIVGSDDFVSKSKGGSFDAPVSVPSPLTVRAQDDDKEGGEIVLKGAGTNPDIIIDGHEKLLRITSSAGERYIDLETGETNFITGGTELLTSSGTYTVKKTGPHLIILVGGGGGGCYGGAGGGGGGVMTVQNLTKGQNITYTIGGGGARGNPNDSNNDGYSGGATSFNGTSAPGGGGGDAWQDNAVGGRAGNALATDGDPMGSYGKPSNGGYSFLLNSYGRGGNGRWNNNGNIVAGAAGQAGAIVIIS